MKKYYITLFLVIAVSAVSFGQTTNPKLNEVKKDPKTTENAAKADGQVVNKKNVTDQSTLKSMFANKRKMNARKRKSPYRRSA